MKHCFSFTTIDALHLIPFLWMFEESFIREMGNRFTNPNCDLLYQENYISDFLLSKLDGKIFSGNVNNILYLYNFSTIRKIQFFVDNELVFDL